jgi:hypothetical protein
LLDEVIAMNTGQLHKPRPQPLSVGHDPLLDENVKLANRVRQLREALDASTRDNARLRRLLAQACAENRQPQAALTARPAHSDPRRHIRMMLSDPTSRNP